MELTRCGCIIIILMIGMLLPSLGEANNVQCLEESTDKLGDFSTVTFNLNSGINCYGKFLDRIRNLAVAPTLACGIKSTRRIALRGEEYILVNLKISNTEWVTLVMDATTLYVWAYQSNKKYNGELRANFLKDASSEAKHTLFPGARQRIMEFGENYRDIELRADVTRLNLVLGLPNLENAIRSVYGKEDKELNTGESEAKFILIVAQMVAEATRFKYIEEAIIKGDNSPVMKGNMVSFQNDWDDISQAIHQAESAKPKCGDFPKPLQVGIISFRNVTSIKDSLGIIKYKEEGKPKLANSVVENGSGD